MRPAVSLSSLSNASDDGDDEMPKAAHISAAEAARCASKSNVRRRVRAGASQHAAPLQVLVELFDLKLHGAAGEGHVESGGGGGGGGVWRQSARWIKYEENVEVRREEVSARHTPARARANFEGVERHFGRPHVSFLSFHALVQLRRCLTRGELI